MTTRRATHAGSWYTRDAQALDAHLTANLAAVDDKSVGETFPIAGCKAVIAPHAGYTYSGPTAAWAYKAIETKGIKRVFILGPSHHVYLNTCALSRCKKYETPIGDLPLDTDTIKELAATNEFDHMDINTDEDEHSIEMHLPYIRKVFEGLHIKVVPILVGAIDQPTEAHFGAVLAPYLAREDTICVVSSDFCHWGPKFSYTRYYPPPPATPSSASFSAQNNYTHLSRSSSRSTISPSFPIHASIEALDREGMDLIASASSSPTDDNEKASAAHRDFATYLARTKNTICGRHPIGVLLGALAALEKGKEGSEGKEVRVKWVRYAQSVQCTSPNEESVSYASAFAVF